MDATISVVGTIAVVSVGQWNNDKAIDIKFVVGSGIYALAIGLMGSGNAKLANQFALLVFVTAVLIYGVDIAKGFGLIKREPGEGKKVGKIQR